MSRLGKEFYAAAAAGAAFSRLSRFKVPLFFPLKKYFVFYFKWTAPRAFSVHASKQCRTPATAAAAIQILEAR